ncbi:MAG TPA: twin-arginine translocase TatA/TatE family subunit [Candidatus Didemnitutus sp.]|nr:twin-arginine translocase TatA/TatE family subunit [Candidatus Didemnitutus sp.]
MSLTSLPIAVFGIGGSELLIILLIVLLLFGGAKLPQLARGMGESIREFKKASKEEPETKASGEKKTEEGHGKN